jgi:hypothetical protein
LDQAGQGPPGWKVGKERFLENELKGLLFSDRRRKMM